MVLDLDEPKITYPKDLPDDPTDFQKMIRDGRTKQYLKREEMTVSNIGNLFSLILGQCSRPLKKN